MTMVVDFCSDLLPTASKDATVDAGRPTETSSSEVALVRSHGSSKFVENQVAKRAKTHSDLVRRFLIVQPTRKNKLCVPVASPTLPRS